MQEPLTPASNGGVPASEPIAPATPAGEPQATPNPVVPAESNGHAPQATPDISALEAKFAAIEAQNKQLMEYVLAQSKQPQTPVAPQAPAVPTKTFEEKLMELGDPLSAEDPNEWLRGLGRLMNEERQSILGELNPTREQLQKMQQEREAQRQQSEFTSAFKGAHPQLANVPDQVIIQRLTQYSQDPNVLMQVLAADLSQTIGKLQTQPQQQIPHQTPPDPGKAATIPNGAPQANFVKMQSDYQAWKQNPNLAITARAQDPAHFAEVHRVAAENKW